MAQTTTTPTPRKRPGILRILLIVTAVLLALLVAAFFYLTSASFVKGTVLPKAGAALNSDITVSEVAIHPFRSVTFRDLKLTPRGRETLLTATEVRANYSLWQILRGDLLVEDITIAAPTIHLVERADGSSNLDPILQATAEKKEPDKDNKPEPGDSNEAPRVDIRKVSITDATLRQEKQHARGGRDLTEISNASLHLANLKNGDSGKLLLAAEVLIANAASAGASNSLLRAGVNGEYVFAMSADLKPLSVKGETQLKVSRAEGTFADLNALGATVSADIAPTEITQLALKFSKAGEQLGQLLVSGPFNSEKLEGDLKVELRELDRRVLNLAGAASGIDFGTTAISSSNSVRIAEGAKSIQVAGQFAANRLQLIRTNQSTPTLNIAARYDLAVNSRASNAVLRAFTLTGTQNGKPLLRGELSSPMAISLGGAGEAIGDSTLNFSVENLNFADWKAFAGDIPQGTASLQLMLVSKAAGKDLHIKLQSQLANVSPVAGDKTLASATLSGDVGVQLGANESTTIRGGIQVSNLVVNDPSGKMPREPLAASLNLDTTASPSLVDLRRFEVALTPTERAKNQLQLQGRVDLSDTNATQGELKLTAESLDVTRYYDLFAGGDSKTPAATGGAPSAGTGSSGPASDQEPVATQLPFKNFRAEGSIQRFYLREIAASNLVVKVLLNGGQIQIAPFELQLNGAPLNANVNLDLGVPGYRYAVAFKADHLPFAPLVNTFQPERKGELGGTLWADAELNGQGTTGANLQKHLNGKFDIATTNLNLSAANIRQPMLKLLVSVIAMVPQLAQNPEAALGSFVGGFGSALKGGGLTGDLTNSPIDVIAFRGGAGDGKIELEQATVRSTIFQADARGTITLAPVLTNSQINIPVSIALVRALAERIKMVPASTPTNATYAKLPDFFTETGTIGNPKAKIDKKALAGSILQQVGGLIPGAANTNSTVGNVLQGLGGLLGNRPAAATNTPPPGTISVPTTNAPATNAPATPLNEVLKLLGPRTKPNQDGDAK